ncbi:head-tail connector protein [Alloscardovia omnicolens]|uniref:head-tail connector protein n=1 Tax=Alloscardovia omnicolens TaxID=419015 RepID=UPI003A737EA3
MIDLESVKQYLRVDFEDDDALIELLITSAKELVASIAREDNLADSAQIDVAVNYAVAYLYEHREEANHHELTLTLRSLLTGNRKEVF